MRLKLYEQHQLWLPLVSSISLFRSPKEATKVGQWERFKQFETDYWENEDIIRCHAFLLEESVKELFDGRASARTKQEVIEWMNDDLQSGRPFSFRVCCELFNADHEIVRRDIFGRMERQSRLQIKHPAASREVLTALFKPLAFSQLFAPRGGELTL